LLKNIALKPLITTANSGRGEMLVRVCLCGDDDNTKLGKWFVDQQIFS